MRHAILFDLDGTLVDSLEDIADALNAALRDSGYPTHPVAAYRQMVGDGARELVRRAVPSDAREAAGEGFDQLFDQLFARYREHFHRHLVVHTRPYDGIDAMLEALRGLGLALGVVTNKPHGAAREVVERVFSEGTFELVLGQREGIPHKPDPAGLREALAALGAEADAALFVGDSDVDVEAARRAGTRSVGVSWGFRGRAELARAGADHLVDRPDEIVALARTLLAARP